MTFLKIFCLFKLCFFLIINFIYLFDEITCEEPRNDLQFPRASDLIIFLNTLKKIKDYAINNANAVDMNLMLGIFLAKVNMEASRRVLGAIPYEDEALLEEVDSGCDVILRNYHLQLAIHNSSDRREARISSLFTNITAWALALPPYTPPRVSRAPRRPPATPRRSDALRWQWDMYRDAVRQYEAWVPSPQLSDECLMTLAADVAAADSADSAADSLQLRPCRTSDVCYAAVYHGTWFGYALTHRLLIITSGLFSRHCYLSTPAEDARLTRQLCARTYTETAFIAHNHYSLRDLFMEQISMCSLLGHVEFLDRSWLIQIVHWQHSAGCFQEQYQRHGYQEQNKRMKLKHLGKNLYTSYFENFLANHINDNNTSTMDRSGKSTKQVNNKHNKEVEHEEHLQQVVKHCDSHVTAVAAAAISAAIRFIIQFYESAI